MVSIATAHTLGAAEKLHWMDRKKKAAVQPTTGQCVRRQRRTRERSIRAVRRRGPVCTELPNDDPAGHRRWQPGGWILRYGAVEGDGDVEAHSDETEQNDVQVAANRRWSNIEPIALNLYERERLTW